MGRAPLPLLVFLMTVHYELADQLLKGDAYLDALDAGVAAELPRGTLPPKQPQNSMTVYYSGVETDEMDIDDDKVVLAPPEVRQRALIQARKAIGGPPFPLASPFRPHAVSVLWPLKNCVLTHRELAVVVMLGGAFPEVEYPERLVCVTVNSFSSGDVLQVHCIQLPSSFVVVKVPELELERDTKYTLTTSIILHGSPVAISMLQFSIAKDDMGCGDQVCVLKTKDGVWHRRRYQEVLSIGYNSFMERNRTRTVP